MRGDGRIFLRDETYWISLYIDGREYRESTNTSDEKSAQKYLQNRRKEANAHELDAAKPFITQRDRKRTINGLMDGLKTDYEIRGKWSRQVRPTSNTFAKPLA